MKYLAGLLIVIGLLLSGSSFYAESHFMYNGPTSPDAKAGNIYERNKRGKIVYLTRVEALVNDWMFGAGALLALGGSFLREREKAKQNRGYPST